MEQRDEHLLRSEGYAGISQAAKYAIGGLLKHAPALLAFCAPTTNSYKRLVPGYEAPVNLVYSARNRSAAVRIPMYSDNPKAKRIEFRPPDCMCNPYLSFPAILMACVDGIVNKIDPGNPMDVNTYHMDPKNSRRSRPSRVRWKRRSTPWRRTMSSCSEATSSRKT